MSPSVGTVFDVDTFAVHDGPGIRMAVYLKGCPLSCAWCHSPESQSPQPELIFIRSRCRCCGACVVACRQGTHSLDEGRRRIDRRVCVACGACASACPGAALQIKGRSASAEEIVARAVRMKPFFEHSGGGVTLTGGEVTLQPEFAETILAGCHAEGIHTAIETCGACAWDRFERLVAHADLVLYDLKLVDEVEHRRWTGASNRRILANAERLAGHNVQVRIPLIPGITDTEANLRGIFGFMQQAGLSSAALLPYNPSTAAKYEWLGRTCTVARDTQDEAQLGDLLALAREAGIDAEVG